jgi:hypothetical protein
MQLHWQFQSMSCHFRVTDMKSGLVVTCNLYQKQPQQWKVTARFSIYGLLTLFVYLWEGHELFEFHHQRRNLTARFGHYTSTSQTVNNRWNQFLDLRCSTSFVSRFVLFLRAPIHLINFNRQYASKTYIWGDNTPETNLNQIRHVTWSCRHIINLLFFVVVSQDVYVWWGVKNCNFLFSTGPAHYAIHTGQVTIVPIHVLASAVSRRCASSGSKVNYSLLWFQARPLLRTISNSVFLV